LFWTGAATAQDLPLDQQRPPTAAPTAKVESDQLATLDTTPQFDPMEATNQYLARVNGAARTRSDAYTNGNYGWMVVDFIYGLLIAGLLLWLKIAAYIRDWAEEKTRNRAYQVMIFGAIYVCIVTAATFPLS